MGCFLSITNPNIAHILYRNPEHFHTPRKRTWQCKINHEWRCIFPLEHWEFPACHVSFQVCFIKSLHQCLILPKIPDAQCMVCIFTTEICRLQVYRPVPLSTWVRSHKFIYFYVIQNLPFDIIPNPSTPGSVSLLMATSVMRSSVNNAAEGSLRVERATFFKRRERAGSEGTWDWYII